MVDAPSEPGGAKWSGAEIQIEQIGILSGASVMTDCEAQPGATWRHTHTHTHRSLSFSLQHKCSTKTYYTHTLWAFAADCERRKSLKSLRGIFALLLGDATVWYHLMDGYWYIFYITSHHVINLREKKEHSHSYLFPIIIVIKRSLLELRAKRYMRMGNAGAY